MHQIYRRSPLNSAPGRALNRSERPQSQCLSGKSTPWSCSQNHPDHSMLLRPLIRVEKWDDLDLSFPTPDTQSLPPLFFRSRHLAFFTFVCQAFTGTVWWSIWFNHKDGFGRDWGRFNNSSHRWRSSAPHPAANCRLPWTDHGLPGDGLGWSLVNLAKPPVPQTRGTLVKRSDCFLVS